MTLYTRKKVVAAKIEGTVGTAETLVAADAAINIMDPQISLSIGMTTRQGNGGFGHLASVPEGYDVTVTFSNFVEWDGTATEPKWADTFFPACGYVKSGNVFTPRSDAAGANVKTITIGVYQDGLLGLVAGAMGNAVINMISGQAITIDWTFRGVWQGLSDATMLAPTYPNDHKVRCASGAATYDSTAMCMRQATINLGNEVQLRECFTTDAGFIAANITNRRPTITVDPESVLVATYDRYGKHLDQSEAALHLQAKGVDADTPAYFEIDAPKAQIVSINSGDRNGMMIDNIEFQCNRNGSTQDQELSITFEPLVAA